MKDGEFDYPEHPEEYLPPWMFEIEDCPKCRDILQDSIPSHEVWDGDICECGEEE